MAGVVERPYVQIYFFPTHPSAEIERVVMENNEQGWGLRINKSLGHVALKIHRLIGQQQETSWVSFWPTKACKLGPPDYSEDHQAISHFHSQEEDQVVYSGQSVQDWQYAKDHSIRLYSLDVEKIDKRFKEIKAQGFQQNRLFLKWSWFGSGPQGLPFESNCSGLVFHLLEQGGLNSQSLKRGLSFSNPLRLVGLVSFLLALVCAKRSTSFLLGFFKKLPRFKIIKDTDIPEFYKTIQKKVEDTISLLATISIPEEDQTLHAQTLRNAKLSIEDAAEDLSAVVKEVDKDIKQIDNLFRNMAILASITGALTLGLSYKITSLFVRSVYPRDIYMMAQQKKIEEEQVFCLRGVNYQLLGSLFSGGA